MGGARPHGLYANNGEINETDTKNEEDVVMKI